MGLFAKILKSDEVDEQQAVEPQPTGAHTAKPRAVESDAAESQKAEPEAGKSRKADTKAADTKAADEKAAKQKAGKSKGSKSKAAKSKASKSKAAKSKAAKSQASEAPVVEVLPAVESSDAEHSMSAPSLQDAIITKARDLSRLSREDLLQLLLTQSKDAERLQDYLREVADEFERYTSQNARLREKLDAKDEQIERLKGRLDDKDRHIASMQARLDELEVLKQEEERRSQIIVSAVEGVRGALEAFNVTADWHIASLQGLSEELESQPARAATPNHEPATDSPGEQEAGMPGASQEPAMPGGNSKAADA